MSGIVLLATQDQRVLIVCEMVATFVDLDVEHRRNGRDLFAAIRRLRSESAASIKIVLVDDDLEDMRGSQLIPLLRDEFPDLKVIYIAGADEPDVEVRVRRAGVHCVIDKPVEATLLEKILRKTLDHETTRLLAASGRGAGKTATAGGRP